MQTRRARCEKPETPDMTPMIDVVFQLLIFFLVVMKFKTLDMKLDAFLPKNRGPNHTPATPPEFPTVEARLVRTAAGTRLKVQNRDVGSVDGPDAEATWAHLVAHARTLRQRSAEAGMDPDEVRGEVDAGPTVRAGTVIRAVDALIAAHIAEVTFKGTKPLR